MDKPPPRQEHEVLTELRQLCTSPGYIHAVASLCLRDNFIEHSGTIQTEQMLRRFSEASLIRNEISTLIGFMLSAEIDRRIPAPEMTQSYIDRSDGLLRELHDAITAPFYNAMAEQISSGKGDDDLFSKGAFLRDPIFYSTESAYNFQFREMAANRYQEDEEWLKANKGFTASDAVKLFRALMPLQSERVATTVELAQHLPAELWSVLSGFTFTSDELAETTRMSPKVVESILTAFTVPDGERNSGFIELNSYNVATSSPLIRIENSSSYILLQPYTLFESLYDSPFYWMLKDPSYKPLASKHRGEFTERFCVDRLKRVFGPENVHQNVMLHHDKHSIAGDIDVLVTFANRCIVLQAKSKRLTIPARKGNEGSIRDDFRKSVQDAYEQGFDYGSLLLDRGYKILNADGSPVDVTKIAHIYLLCVVSDHYPALSFQAKQFLTTKDHSAISRPFVLDVFTIDVLAEFLTSPLYFLSYIERRTRYDSLFSASHELVLLAYHLKYNLWSDGSYDSIALEDDLSVDLDMAMYARRDGAPAPKIPKGLLTNFVGTPFHSLVRSIEQARSAQTIDLGFLLLELSGNAIEQLNSGIVMMRRLRAKDGVAHDFTLGTGRSGITVHCSPQPDLIAQETLHRHAMRRKYIAETDTWFGLCLNTSGGIRFGVNLKQAWKYNPQLAQVTAGSSPLASNIECVDGSFKKKKVGRNDRCPCRSGKKYKRCCST